MYHGTEEEFELYAMGRLTPERGGRLEEHLLVCDPCRQQMDEAAAYCLTMRQELSRPEKPAFWFGWNWLRLPSPAMAGVAMAAALLLLVVAGSVLLRRGAPLVPLATIQLSAMRGEMVVAAEARETDMVLLDAATYAGNAEVVDASGRPVWKGPLAEGGRLRVTKALAKGTYFVRLFDGLKLTREYGFQVR